MSHPRRAAALLRGVGGRLVHEDDCGVLWRFEAAPPIAMVQVRNSTPEPDGSFRLHALRVPPTCATAREAVAWTFGLEEDDYDPRAMS
jgi:hypothetical protein